MSNASYALETRWRSRRHIGPWKPAMDVWIQRGVLDRHFAIFEMLDGSREHFGNISGGKHNDKPWHAFWRATGPWIKLPGVTEVQIEQGFDDNGVGHASITIENVLMQRVAGAIGAFTAIRRGWLSPWFGYRAAGRPITNQQVNEWFDVLNGGYRIRVDQGYGNLLEPEFAGLVDDTDISVNPDHITITCRSFGQALTDQRVFGDAKAKDIRSPVIFCDRGKADNLKKVSAGARASTSEDGYPASAVTRKDDSYWRSHEHSTRDATEWVQIRLSKGRYEDFYLDPSYPGMNCYISVYLHGDSKVNGQTQSGWATVGEGLVPGDEGGIPYIRMIPDAGDQPLKREIGAVIECGDNSILRLSFRDLGRSGDGYRAGARRLVAYSRTRKKEARQKHWILVEDASDVVRWACMWAGFHEWNIDNMGVPLKEHVTFHQSEFLIDIVNKMKAQGDFQFFIDRPTGEDLSIGVPTFRRSRALQPPAGRMTEVRDTDLLTAVDTRFTKEPLAYVIRSRGKVDKARGRVLGEDTAKRFMATYWPPWSGAHRSIWTGKITQGAGRLSGVIKHVVHVDENLESGDECRMACILIAIQEALASFTGHCTFPGLPGTTLDSQVSVIDTASGTNQRIWVASKSSTFTVGEETKFSTTVGGSMIDNPDLAALASDYAAILKKVQQSYE